MDFARAASQNGFSSYKLSLHKKTNIVLKTTKRIGFFNYFNFYHGAVGKQDFYKIHLWSYVSNV
jgi:hypothetical protein